MRRKCAAHGRSASPICRAARVCRTSSTSSSTMAASGCRQARPPNLPRRWHSVLALPGGRLRGMFAETENRPMNIAQLSKDQRSNLPFYAERVDLACAFRWTARLNMHEAVANHFSLAVDDSGTRFLMNPNQVHFSRIKASDLLLIDANDPETMNRPDAPDPTAWGLHGAIHRNVPHARCVMHVHSIHATVLASLADSTLPPIDQNSAMFFGRHVVDDNYGGLAFEEEGERCSQLFSDPK